jgi:hypothetical protein
MVCLLRNPGEKERVAALWARAFVARQSKAAAGILFLALRRSPKSTRNAVLPYFETTPRDTTRQPLKVEI